MFCKVLFCSFANVSQFISCCDRWLQVALRRSGLAGREGRRLLVYFFLQDLLRNFALPDEERYNEERYNDQEVADVEQSMLNRLHQKIKALRL